jgi:hypothetical protein
MNFNIFSTTFGLIFLFHQVLGQTTPREQLNSYLETGKVQMKDGNYDLANMTFRKVLTLNIPLPPEFCYLFAETLYMVGQYQNSKSFLEKYFDLTGARGDYFEQADELKNVIEEKLHEVQTCQLCDASGYKLVICDDCSGKGSLLSGCDYCKEKGIVSCIVCKGEGVKIVRNFFGDNEYSTCDHCQGKGFTDCPVCKGNKEHYSSCRICKGKGLKASTSVCDHKINP